MMPADDRTSSATVLFERAERTLRVARATGEAAAREAAASVCSAQPCMGALWNLSAVAIDADPERFERLAAQARRARAAVARHAAGLLGGDTARVLTCSRSAIVEACLRALDLAVVCAESRPGLEGRALAAALAGQGRDVTVVADAAIASEFRAGDVVLVGADAVAPGWFINKTGTGQLCAAAGLAGVPTYVVTGREKFVSPAMAGLLRLREDAPDTLWSDPPAGVRVANPLFERVSLDRVAGLITDAGLLAGDMVGQACESVIPARAVQRLVDLLAQA